MKQDGGAGPDPRVSRFGMPGTRLARPRRRVGLRTVLIFDGIRRFEMHGSRVKALGLLERWLRARVARK